MYSLIYTYRPVCKGIAIFAWEYEPFSLLFVTIIVLKER